MATKIASRYRYYYRSPWAAPWLPLGYPLATRRSDTTSAGAAYRTRIAPVQPCQPTAHAWLWCCSVPQCRSVCRGVFGGWICTQQRQPFLPPAPGRTGAVTASRHNQQRSGKPLQEPRSHQRVGVGVAESSGGIAPFVTPPFFTSEHFGGVAPNPRALRRRSAPGAPPTPTSSAAQVQTSQNNMA